MRLLLVEDDLELVQILQRDLEKAGYALDIANDGIEAEYMGREGVYDLVVLDLGLPQRNGIKVLTNWRSEGIGVPVIILTARDEWHQRVDGFKAGADDYVGKPFHMAELLARIEALMHRAHQQPGGLLSHGNLTLDEERQMVKTSGGETLDLTGTEFRMLRYFLLHPDRIISKSTLMEHVYDFNTDLESNVIEVYIKRLRQKLGKEIIETRRGQGYLFRGQP